MSAWLSPVQQALARLSPRERNAVTLAGLVLLCALLWLLAWRPAWRTWTEVPAQREALESQQLLMQRLAGEARELQAQPTVSAAQSAQALKAATERLGAAGRLVTQADRATLTLSAATPEQLRAWLAEVRSGARARPVDLQLRRGAQGLDGQVVVALPHAGD